MKKPIRLIALILSILTLLPATCSYNGYCADMDNLSYPNFEMPWWPESLLDVVSIGDSIYFASGDASINMLHLMYALYFNKDLLSEFRLDDPVYLVRNHKWTLDALN
jgi:ABC-type glycerol-3-phosphate transport system substrate-binding protein